MGAYSGLYGWFVDIKKGRLQVVTASGLIAICRW
jgi:hypothetical protein